ncbi:MAG: hypothetical protein M3R69_05120 [Acidobacteriota bacterium]|nr:hypothetical protein [Acidobacteriota bacterium]
MSPGQNLRTSFTASYDPSFKKPPESPEAYDIRERDLRRANLERFPYHFLFRIVRDRVRILVVRHHRRRPSLGLHRR